MFKRSECVRRVSEEERVCAAYEASIRSLYMISTNMHEFLSIFRVFHPE